MGKKVEIELEKIHRQMEILEHVAEHLKDGSITTANMSHNLPIRAYTIQNVVNNIRNIIGENRIEYNN